MRLCRFSLDELILTGFYADDHVIPIDQASEAYCEDLGVELLLPTTEDLLDLLPPDGCSSHAVAELARWVDGLDADARAELSLPIESVQLLVPIAHPRKIFLLAGNYAKHVAEGGGTVVPRGETFPYVFLKPPTTTLTHPGDPIVLPAMSPDHIDWECELGVVIGRACRDVDEEEALDYVAGYTIVNDVSDRKFALPDADPDEGARPLLRLAHGQVARHLLPGRPVRPLGRRGGRPAGPRDPADGQRRGQAGRDDGRDDLPRRRDRRHSSRGS